MAWYRTGTVTVTNGSATVTGAGTDFVSNTQIGECFLGPDGRVYEIAAVVSSTQLTIIPAYQGSTAGAQAFGIQPTSSFARDLALGVSQLLNGFAAVRDGVGQGLIQPGSASTPALRNANDQDTGIYWPEANIVSISAGGTPIVNFRKTDMQVAGNVSLIASPASIGYSLGDQTTIRGVSVPNYGSTYGVAIGLPGAVTVHSGYGGLIFVTAGLERGCFDIGGNLLVGTTTGTNHWITKSGLAEGGAILQIDGGTGSAISAQFRRVNANAFNGANSAALMLGNNTTNNRSLSAGGTLNASGADYAEYMVKSQGCGTIAPGDVCGVDVNSLLTQSFAASVSFVVKSTDPAYVGGDNWAVHLPPRPDQGADEPDAAYAARLAPWEQQVEAARATVDRIAFCGQVPCNAPSGSFAVGDYIVAGAGPNDTIVPVVVKAVDMTFGDYTKRIGKVWRVMDDGRAWIDVQHG